MIKPIKVQRLGNEVGVLLPDEMLDELGVGEGDYLYPTRTKYGIKLSLKEES